MKRIDEFAQYLRTRLPNTDECVVTELAKDIIEWVELHPKEECGYQCIVEKWNNLPVPKVTKMTPRRKAGIKARLKEGLDVEVLFPLITQSDFLTGHNKEGWRCTFDWIFLSSNNWVKVIEGNYSNKKFGSEQISDKKFNEF